VWEALRLLLASPDSLNDHVLLVCRMAGSGKAQAKAVTPPACRPQCVPAQSLAYSLWLPARHANIEIDAFETSQSVMDSWLCRERVTACCCFCKHIAPSL
jgi:hypothetical protein